MPVWKMGLLITSAPLSRAVARRQVGTTTQKELLFRLRCYVGPARLLASTKQARSSSSGFGPSEIHTCASADQCLISRCTASHSHFVLAGCHCSGRNGGKFAAADHRLSCKFNCSSSVAHATSGRVAPSPLVDLPLCLLRMLRSNFS